MRSVVRAVLCVLAGLMTSPLFAQEPDKAAIAKQIKAATALVEVTKFKHGSAFCIHESGYFLTNEHVVGNSGEVKLILHPGLKEKQVVKAKIVRADKDLDLALLKVDDKLALTTLPLGSCAGIGELTEVIAAGFPFGKSLALDEGGYPEVSVNVGRVTALRKKLGELERIQMDAVVNPGNSGGPVLDTKGKVIGMVVSGVRGATVNFAIPVTHLLRFVNMPEVQVIHPTIDYADRFKAAEIRVRANSVIPSTKDDYQVELRLGSKSRFRSYEMKYENGVYRTVTEVLRSPSSLHLAVTFQDGRIEGIVEDRTFKMGGKTIKLSEVRTLRMSRTPHAVLADATSITGPPSGLDDLSLSLGAVTLPLHINKAIEVTVEPSANETKFEYTVVVRKDNQELVRMSDHVGFKGTPGGADWSDVAKKLEGLWLLDREDANGGKWPIPADQGLLIENQKVVWVKESGKALAGSPRGQIKVDPSKTPMTMDIVFPSTTWVAIFKVEGNRLTIATNCDEERRPVQFTTQLTAGAERATFVRVYKLKTTGDGK